jgi:tetratricopeptide (TPR) repeat protein
LKLRPGYAFAHCNLGLTLNVQGKLEQAIAEFREAIRRKPDSFEGHLNLGDSLRVQRKLDEALSELSTALKLKPDQAESHACLGLARRARGEFADSIAELRKALEVARSNLPLALQIEREIVDTERQAYRVARLPEVLAGKRKPGDTGEMTGFAQRCYERELHAFAGRLWSEAFQSQPKRVEDMQAQHHYNAASAAALAGSGQAQDDPPLDEPTKARWRKQAIDWLKADLAAWSKLLMKDPAANRETISKTLLP